MSRGRTGRSEPAEGTDCADDDRMSSWALKHTSARDRIRDCTPLVLCHLGLGDLYTLARDDRDPSDTDG